MRLVIIQRGKIFLQLSLEKMSSDQFGTIITKTPLWSLAILTLWCQSVLSDCWFPKLFVRLLTQSSSSSSTPFHSTLSRSSETIDTVIVILMFHALGWVLLWSTFTHFTDDESELMDGKWPVECRRKAADAEAETWTESCQVQMRLVEMLHSPSSPCPSSGLGPATVLMLRCGRRENGCPCPHL